MGAIILVLHFMGVIPLDAAITGLYILGALCLIAEIAVISMGLLTLNGLLALYAAYSLQTGKVAFFGLDIGWSLIFAVAFIELAILIGGVAVWRKLKNQSTSTGSEGMIGQKATVIEWSGAGGRVSFEGESWAAQSESPLTLNAGDSVTIQALHKLCLIIKP